jgi:hypothetical protein
MSRWKPAILRFIRRAATIVSLICFLGAATLCVRSRWLVDSMSVSFERNPPRGWRWVNIELVSIGNKLIVDSDIAFVVDHSRRDPNLGARAEYHSRRFTQRDSELRDAPRWWNRLGFSFEGFTVGPDLPQPLAIQYAVGFPHWVPLLIFAGLPFFWLRSIWKPHGQKRVGLCVTCGYDLRASTDRCPECGTEIARGMGNLPMHSAAQRHA